MSSPEQDPHHRPKEDLDLKAPRAIDETAPTFPDLELIEAFLSPEQTILIAQLHQLTFDDESLASFESTCVKHIDMLREQGQAPHPLLVKLQVQMVSIFSVAKQQRDEMSRLIDLHAKEGAAALRSSAQLLQTLTDVAQDYNVAAAPMNRAIIDNLNTIASEIGTSEADSMSQFLIAYSMNAFLRGLSLLCDDIDRIEAHLEPPKPL